MQWLLTSYRSPHPSLSGHCLVILPYMGYVMCNEQVWSHFDLREFDLVSLSKSTSLNHTLYEEVMNKQREVLLVNSSFGTVGKVLERRRIGIRQLYCNIDSLWYIETKDYDSSTSQYYWNPQHKSGTFNFQIEKCTEVVESCIRTIQKFFRHRRWLRSYPMSLLKPSFSSTSRSVTVIKTLQIHWSGLAKLRSLQNKLCRLCHVTIIHV